MATKFVSALTGPEMDSALTDMAYHNSEAYAVGTRNGVAVGSSDVTYHNNSKYWAEQVYGYTDRAEDAANRAEAAVPSGTAGAVFFDRAQTLTTEQQGQAKANISAGSTNPNLLDNPWFTVNQRGTSGTISSANQFGADRWKKSGGSGSVVVGDGYFTPVGGGGYRQLNPWNKIVNGRTYTVSAMTADGNVYSTTGILSSTASGWQISTHLIPNSLWCGVQNNGGNLDVIFTGANGDIQVIAVKLEVGSFSTLANDTPPDYAEELAKCRYYFRRIINKGGGDQWMLTGVCASSNVGVFVLDEPMRDAGATIAYSGSLKVNASTVNSISAYNHAGRTIFQFVTSGGLTLYNAAGLIISGGGYLDVSRDL